jgi:hypothetical protein
MIPSLFLAASRAPATRRIHRGEISIHIHPLFAVALKRDFESDRDAKGIALSY